MERSRWPCTRETAGSVTNQAMKGSAMIDEATLTPALDEVRALVQADGGDMTLVALSDVGKVDLRLVVEGASCEECVMPREILEQIALDMLHRKVPAVTSVSIDDPREHPDYVPQSH
jgi:Fe-S cluster biogenesis protein NfuA